MITCGQVPSVSWFDPEGLNTMRSAPHWASEVLRQIYLETRSLRWERPSAEEHIWHYNSMTSSFLPFFCFSSFSLSLSPLYQCFYELREDLGLVLSSGTLSISDPSTVADHNHFFIFYSCAFLNFIIHLSPTTWTEWHHLGLDLIISTLQLWWTMAFCSLCSV